MSTPPDRMRAALLTGHGGPEMIEVRDDVTVPSPGAGEVLVRVAACGICGTDLRYTRLGGLAGPMPDPMPLGHELAGINNTDINTRIGWYSPEVRSATDDPGLPSVESGGWGGSLAFPRVQGADICGRVVALGEGSSTPIGARVLVDPWVLDPDDPTDHAAAGFVGSEIDGGFAEFCVVPERNAHVIASSLSDVELATFPCAATTAEHLLRDAEVGDGSVVVITGASGGVGTCAVQLAKAQG
ncbi:MAG: alcohol dehydrogenase catalytic domain-containing protein, partial [Ilumatobacteraceae bacterium]